MYYIISLINTLPQHKHILLWGKGGHTFIKETAKVKPEPVVIRHNPDAVLAVPVAEVDKLLVATTWNNNPVHALPNTPAVRAMLKVKMTREGLVKVNRD